MGLVGSNSLAGGVHLYVGYHHFQLPGHFLPFQNNSRARLGVTWRVPFKKPRQFKSVDPFKGSHQVLQGINQVIDLDYGVPVYSRVKTMYSSVGSVFLGKITRALPALKQRVGVLVDGSNLYFYLRPYRDEPSASRPIRADKHRRGQRVLTWVTSREHCAAAGFLLVFLYRHFDSLFFL